MSALILSTIARGVFGGATTAYQAADSKPGSVSAMVGTSGSEAMRVGVATASRRSRPLFTNASETPRLSNIRSTLPATRSANAGAEPRYGTCCSFTPAIIWNISEVRCEVVPLPWVADVTLPGRARASAITSGTLWGGNFALTTSAFGTRTITTMGTNWVGSKLSLG